MLACIKADELRTIYRQRRLNGGENRNNRYRLEGEAAGVNDAVIEMTEVTEASSRGI